MQLADSVHDMRLVRLRLTHIFLPKATVTSPQIGVPKVILMNCKIKHTQVDMYKD